MSRNQSPRGSLSSTASTRGDFTMPWPLDAGSGPAQARKSRTSPTPSVSEESNRRASGVSHDDFSPTKDTFHVEGTGNGATYMRGIKRMALMSCLTIAMFLMLLDTSIIATAIPRITDDFHSLQDVGWYISVYQLASAALQPLSGKIYQKFNNKASFLAFFLVFETGSLVCAAAQSSGTLIAGRTIAGIGSSGLLNGGLTIITAVAPMHERPQLTGSLLGLSQLGVVLGPLLGGIFTSCATWRWCFYVNLPIGALAVVGLLFIDVPEQHIKPLPVSVLRRLHMELDLPGCVLIAAAAVQLLLALSWGGTAYGWDSVCIVGLFCGAGATTIVWLVWNWYRGDQSLLPFDVIKVNAVWSGALTHCFLLTSLYCASFFLPMYFQAVRGASPLMSGVYVLASILPQLLMTALAGKLVTCTGYIIPFALLAAVIGSVSSGLYTTLTPTTATAQWIGYQILNGVGRGLGMQMPNLAVQAVLPLADVSIGIAFLVFGQTLGISIVLAVADAIFEGSLGSELPKQAPLAESSAIIEAGATRFRDIVSDQDMPGVLVAYSIAINRVFYLAAGVTGLAVFSSLFLGWVRIRKAEVTVSRRGEGTCDRVVKHSAR